MRSKDQESRTFTEGARRAQIVDCAIEAVAELGYPQASVRKIAQQVGVAMSVVLYHFANKDELVEAIVAEIYRSTIAVMIPAVEAETTAAGKLRAYIRANMTFINSHRSQQVALAEIWSNYRSSTGRRLHEVGLNPEIQGDLAKLDPESIFRQGQDAGEFRPFPAPVMAVALRGALNGAVAEVLRDPGFDVLGYGEEMVTVFDLATGRMA